MQQQAEIYPLTTGYDLYLLLRGFGKNHPCTVTYRARKQNTMIFDGASLHFNIIKNSPLVSIFRKRYHIFNVGDLLSHLEKIDEGAREMKRQNKVAQVVREDIHKAFEVLESLRCEGIGDLECSYRVRKGVIVRLEYSVSTSGLSHRSFIRDLPELDNNSALRLLFPANLRDENIANLCIDIDFQLKKLESAYGSVRSLKLETLSAIITE